MNQGELVKILIKAFKNKRLTVPIDDENHREFEVPINPESYSQNYKVEYDAKKGQGNQGTNPKFKSSAPLEFKFEFIFDGTNTIEGYTMYDLTVRQQIDKFLETVYNLNGEIHQPNFLKIVWGGDFTFDCILTNLDINYVLFKPSGEPLRAKVNATFLNYIEAERRAREEDKKSPDLTHIRKVDLLDSLPYTSYKVYGDANLYMQIAKANELTSFRNLPAGGQLIFPPLDKTSS